MKDQNLGEQIREYYGEQSLPDDRVERILSLGKEIASQPSTTKSRRKIIRWAQWSGLAAMLAVGLFIGSGLNLTTPLSADVTGDVIQDAAQMHARDLEPEVWGNSLDIIQAKLDRLEVSCKGAQCSAIRDGFVIIGARYCQFQSVLGVQIKMFNPETQERLTLYIFPKSSRLKPVHGTEREMDGIKIKTWQDAERVYIMAKSCSITGPGAH